MSSLSTNTPSTTTTSADPDTGAATEEEEGNIFSKYYSQLSHQQNMLTDHVRTKTYLQAFFKNTVDFQGANCLDVGTGSGILAFFCVQAGAKEVWGVEMSRITIAAKKLVSSNGLSSKIHIVKGKMEEVTLPKKVDVIVSEPLGFLLVHERMLESYITGRDRYLKPGGKMFPSNSTIYTAPFTDEPLYAETCQKSDFWCNNDFMGVDLTALHETSMEEAFGQPVVGYFHPDILLSDDRGTHFVDFHTVTHEALKSFEIDFQHTITKTAVCHGIACWFDCDFSGSQETVVLKTGPEAPGTHWYQCRLMFRSPLAVNKNQILNGRLTFRANDSFSYDVKVEAGIDCNPRIETENMVFLQDQHYHYLYAEESAVDAQGMGHVRGNEGQV
ncbi:hypothetical protein TrST_g13302 [Triparma strigata]|uniref:type I protein arginine methyltransferase n=1 Tax=Triparma strigata TaxID=1606541 RepID=A0A9W7BFD8_9STRA|nr:hypothetical protein TrST_g13302 [Triparma strigata]